MTPHPTRSTSESLLANGLSLDLSHPQIMGILNVTPDSFSDGGELNSVAAAVKHARKLLDSGAHMLDVGGESTRPGAVHVPDVEQIRRTEPVIRAIRDAGIAAPISIDTTRAAVAAAALDAGANIINDVSAGTDDAAMLTLAATRGCGIVLMHRLAPPSQDSYSNTYVHDPDYGPEGVTGAVVAYLRARAAAAIAAGVDARMIVLDPGLGFGKTVEQNFELIAHTREIAALGFPVLAASSRKSFVGHATGVHEPQDRVAGSVAAAVAQVLAGASIVRCHDVRAHTEGLQIACAVLRNSESRWQLGWNKG